jgi:hypothetical protein
MMVASLLLLLCFSQASEVKPPDIAYYKPPSQSQEPVWVSVEEAFDEHGDLKPSRVPVGLHGRPVGAYERPRGKAHGDATFRIIGRDECTRALGGSPDHGRPARTVEDLVENSIAIYRARIVGLSYGFYSRKPGVLLRAIPTDVLKASPSISTKYDLLVFHNYARFAAGDLKFCAGFREPRIGEEILVFAYQPPIDELGAIIYVQDRIFFETPAGDLDVLPTWTTRIDTARFPSLDAIGTFVEETLQNKDDSDE